ncbi:MAG TPA: hypothetical protein PLK34_00780 [Candidatus Pacearchaeota archaeon]|nr:hypothetical protein [Candidatus Pacearchaeota archaeon]
MVDAGDKDILQYEDKRDLPQIPKRSSKIISKERSLEQRADTTEEQEMTPEQMDSLYKSRLQVVCGYEQLFRKESKLGQKAIDECLKETKNKNIIFYVLSLNRKYNEFIAENYSLQNKL